jgi:Flp pilus assembly protein TadD
MSRLNHPVGLAAALGLLLLQTGCASLPFGGSEKFDGASQAKLIRQQQEMRAAADANTAASKPIALGERLHQGDVLRSGGDYAGAMWHYLRAHEQNPQDSAPIARMASLHLLSEPGQAESMFRKLVGEHPENGAAHTGLGLALIQRQDWTAARETLTQAVALSPHSAAAYSALGVCLDRMGEHDGARAAYRSATTLHPRYYEALNNLGVSYLTTEEFDAAAETLRRASQQQDRDPAVFNNLGLALGRLGRYDEALAAFRKGGAEQAARNNLGFVHYLNGSYDRAIEEYERALLVDGDQRLLVLRNLRAAKRAQQERHASVEGDRG